MCLKLNMISETFNNFKYFFPNWDNKIEEYRFKWDYFLCLYLSFLTNLYFLILLIYDHDDGIYSPGSGGT